MVKKGYLVLLAISAVVLKFFLKNKKNTDTRNTTSAIPTVQPIEGIDKLYPIAQFEQRITKKMFGSYITPQNSPVKAERFEGFHTGVDVEYEDVKEDVSVFAVCDGEIILAKWVAGYGGTVVLKCQIDNADYYIVYGHLRTSSIYKDLEISKGDKIAVLGKGGSQETDFERKHLHFGIHRDLLDLRGYVQKQDELEGWVDPLAFI